MGDLNKHLKRKTPCDHIKGDPAKKAASNMCIFCRKQLSGKQSLTRHYTVCDIKNNGISVLFEEIRLLKIRVADVNSKIKDNENTASKLQEEKNAEIKELKKQLSTSGLSNGCVYFICIKDTTHFKIGYTQHPPSKRLSALQTGCPSELILYNSVACFNPKRLEHHLHECFREKNIRGEWFDLTLDEVNDIANFLKSS
jgi:hypothetical protein